MALSEQTLSEILEALYEAPLDAARWREFLRLVALTSGGEAAALLIHDFSSAQSSMSAEWGFHPEVAQLYAARYGSIDVWRSAVTAASDWLGISEQFVPSDELRRTEFYNDLLMPYEITHGMFAMVERGPGCVANLSVCRSAQAGPFDEKDLDILRFLKPHIRRAYRLHSEVSAARVRDADLLATLNAISSGAILFDDQMRVAAMNLVAEQIVGTNNGLRVIRQRLQAEHVGESGRLERFVRDAVATSQGRSLESAGAMTISRRNLPPLQILISPIRTSIPICQEIAAVALINDPLRHQRATHEVLRGLYGLTPAECRVALLLGDGHAPRKIANMIGVTENTVRSQIKSIFSKTGVKRQGELIRLLVSNSSPAIRSRDTFQSSGI